MNSPELEQAIAVRLRTAKIITGALIAGQVVFLAVVVWLRLSGNRPPAAQLVVSLTGLAFAGVILVAFFAVPNLVLASWRRQIARGVWPVQQASRRFPAGPSAAAPDDPALRWWDLYQTHHIIRCALLEGAGFFQLIAYLLEGQIFSLATAVALIAGIALLFPTREKVEDWIRTQKDAVEALKGGMIP
jgi:hypothetical protein